MFGGTFDPPHIGHLVAAMSARHEAGLDVVLLVVANVPWQKVGDRSVTPAGIRLSLVEAAVADVDGLEASDLEIRRGGPSYTADTLAELAELHPGASLHLVVGRDVAATIETWERYEEVRDACEVLVVDRPGAAGPLPEGWRWRHVSSPRLEVSSTELRWRVATGRPLRFLLPDGVIARIHELGLYREGPRAGP